MFSQIIDSVRRLFGSNTDRKRRRESESSLVDESDTTRKRVKRDAHNPECGSSLSSSMADWVMRKKKSFQETYHIHDMTPEHAPQVERSRDAPLDYATSVAPKPHVSDQVSFTAPSRSFVCPRSGRHMTRPTIRPSQSEGIFHSKYGMQSSHHLVRSRDRGLSHGDHRRPSKLTVNETFKLEDKRKYADLLQHYMSGDTQTTLRTRQTARIPQTPGSVTPQTPSFSQCGADNRKSASVLTQVPSSCTAPHRTSTSHTPPVLIDLTQPGLPDVTFNFLKKRREERVANESPVATATQGVQDVEQSMADLSTSGSLTDASFNYSRRPKPMAFARTPLSDRLEENVRSCNNLRSDWLASLRDQTLFDAQETERKTRQELITVEDCNEKMGEWEQQLRQRIRKSLRISRRQPAVVEEAESEDEEVDLTVLEEEPAQDTFIVLSEEQEARVTSALCPTPPGQVLVEGYRLQLTRIDLHTLDGLNWLNDEVINFYMNMLMERGEGAGRPTVHAFSTFFYPKLVKMGHSGVKRWTKKVDIFSKDLLLVPVHLGMHWCLAVVDFKEKEVQYFDSMGGNNEQCVNALKNYLSAESLDKRGVVYDTSDWRLVHRQDIPQQMNGSDCGMFACKFAEYVTRPADINFTQEHMPYFRRRMVLEILSKQLM